MVCDERARLLSEYHRAISDSSRAAQKLADLTATAPHEDFRTLARERQRALARVNRARVAYEDHVAKHDCGDVMCATADPI